MCHITPLSPVLAAGRGLTSVTHKPSSQSSITRAWPVGTQCQERCTAKRRTLTASCTSHTPHRRPSANVIGVISLQFYSLPTHPFIQESGISNYALGVYLLSDSQTLFHQTFSIALLVCTCHITYATNLVCSYVYKMSYIKLAYQFPTYTFVHVTGPTFITALIPIFLYNIEATHIQLACFAPVRTACANYVYVIECIMNECYRDWVHACYI